MAQSTPHNFVIAFTILNIIKLTETNKLNG